MAFWGSDGGSSADHAMSMQPSQCDCSTPDVGGPRQDPSREGSWQVPVELVAGLTSRWIAWRGAQPLLGKLLLRPLAPERGPTPGAAGTSPGSPACPASANWLRSAVLQQVSLVSWLSIGTAAGTLHWKSTSGALAQPATAPTAGNGTHKRWAEDTVLPSLAMQRNASKVDCEVA